MNRQNKLVKLLIIGGFAVVGTYFGVVVGSLQWHAYQIRTFCKEVASLPNHELADVASRCDTLLAATRKSTGVDSHGYASIRDREILLKFTLAGKVPEAIQISPRGLSIHYLGEARLAARIDWVASDNFERSPQLLWTVPGDFGASAMLYERLAR